MPHKESPFLCITCGSRYPDPGMCLECPGEPLLDERNDATTQFIADQVERSRFRHDHLITFVAVPPTLVVAGAILYGAYLLGGPGLVVGILDTDGPGPWLLVIPGVAVYLVIRALTERVWPKPDDKPWRDP